MSNDFVFLSVPNGLIGSVKKITIKIFKVKIMNLR